MTRRGQLYGQYRQWHPECNGANMWSNMGSLSRVLRLINILPVHRPFPPRLFYDTRFLTCFVDLLRVRILTFHEDGNGDT